jgi:hypothetical protein
MKFGKNIRRESTVQELLVDLAGLRYVSEEIFGVETVVKRKEVNHRPGLRSFLGVQSTQKMAGTDNEESTADFKSMYGF